jgi:hypothetical protein
MRRGWVVLGAILTVAGALLAYLPLSATGASSAFVSPGEEITFTVSSILGTYGTKIDLFHPYIEVTVGWTASTPVVVKVFPCGSNSNCTNVTDQAPVATGNSSSGSLSFDAQSGVWYAVLLQGGAGASAIVTVNDIGPLAGGLPGMVLFVVGVGLLLAGLVRPPPEPEPEAEPDPETEASPE